MSASRYLLAGLGAQQREPGIADLALGVEQRGEIHLARLVAGERRFESQLGLRQQAAAGDFLGHAGRFQTGHRTAQLAVQAMAERFLAGGCGLQHALRLAFLAAPGALLQRHVEFQHQVPRIDAIPHLHRLHADDEIRKAVAVSQVAALLGAIDARRLDGELRVALDQPFTQPGRIEPRRQRAQGARLGQRRIGAARQHGVDVGSLLPVFGFHTDQLVVQRAALDLGADRVLLGGQAAGVAHLRDLLQLAAEGNVLARQLHRPVGQPVLRVEALDAGCHLDPACRWRGRSPAPPRRRRCRA